MCRRLNEAEQETAEHLSYFKRKTAQVRLLLCQVAEQEEKQQ